MNITSWFVDTINVSSVNGGPTNYAARTYAAARTVKARVEQVDKLVQDANGNEIRARWKIATAEPMDWTDRIWLPGQNPASDQPHTILSLTTAKLKKTVSWRHYEIML